MPLNAVDYQNLLGILNRVPFQGLTEAEGLLVLAAKLRHAIELSNAAPAEAASKE